LSNPLNARSKVAFSDKNVNSTSSIRQLVGKALYLRKLTPEIEEQINDELTRMGYISDVDYEALELLMAEMDSGEIQLVPRIFDPN
jgi:hypothetical protein